jgi:polyketide cyclase/dehydrase/lipid transport protein
MASWRQQALVDAPLPEVWDLICDPSRASEWNEDVITITGGPARIETRGSVYDVTARGPLGLKATTPFEITEFEDMREVKMQCQVTGFYSHWLLTKAQGGTFTELELGVEELPSGRSMRGRAMTAFHTKSFLRRTVEKSLDGVRRAVGRARGS